VRDRIDALSGRGGGIGPRETDTMRQFAIIALVVMAPMAAWGASPQPPIRVTYECPGGRRLFVQYFGTERARVKPTLRKVAELRILRSGSGFRYGNSRQLLVGKGREVMWTQRKGAAPVTCVQVGN